MKTDINKYDKIHNRLDELADKVKKRREESCTISAGSMRNVITNGTFCTAIFSFVKGDKFPEHFHNAKEDIFCVYGKYLISYDDKEIVLEAGDAAEIPTKIVHSGECLEDTALVITLRPNNFKTFVELTEFLEN